MTDEAKIIKKIIALQQLTTANGASQHEVLNATEAIARILEKYNLELSACVAMPENNIAMLDVDTPTTRSCIGHIVHKIGKLCGCHAIKYTDGTVAFLGDPVSTQSAASMYKSIYYAYLGEMKSWRLTPEYRAVFRRYGARRLGVTFTLKYSDAVWWRLDEMEKTLQVAGSNALVVSRAAAIKDALNDLNIPPPVAYREPKSSHNAMAMRAGQSAGNRAPIAKELSDEKI